MSNWRITIGTVASWLRHLAAYWLLLNSICLLLAANQLLPVLPWRWPFSSDISQLLCLAFAATACAWLVAFPTHSHTIPRWMPLIVSLSSGLTLTLAILLPWELDNSILQMRYPATAPLPLPGLIWSLLLATGICTLSCLYGACHRGQGTAQQT